MFPNKKPLILIELNEINFDVVEKYLLAEPSRFPSLKKLMTCRRIRTMSEQSYSELEPWIQWPSVHTVQTFSEHKIFRLGDIVGSKVPQIFEQIERSGHCVGVISAMNAENRLAKPAYFIPDPWTRTQPDKSWWSKTIASAISQAVNGNSEAEVHLGTWLSLGLGVMRFARPAHYAMYIGLILKSRRKPWLKAIILDLFLHDLHLSLFSARKPDFSTLFLNAGAHIQHHYFFNSFPVQASIPHRNPEWYVECDDDPVADVLELYDVIIGEYLSLEESEIIVATGLSQVPYDRTKFYYRLRSHSEFLKSLDIKFSAVHPRMSRDFLIEFDERADAIAARQKLAGVRVLDCDMPLFGEIEDRGTSLFVTMTYPNEIRKTTKFASGGVVDFLLPKVAFVAIKNGMHQEVGFAFFTCDASAFAPVDGSHVSQIGAAIIKYFGVH